MFWVEQEQEGIFNSQKVAGKYSFEKKREKKETKTKISIGN